MKKFGCLIPAINFIFTLYRRSVTIFVTVWQIYWSWYLGNFNIKCPYFLYCIPPLPKINVRHALFPIFAFNYKIEIEKNSLGRHKCHTVTKLIFLNKKVFNVPNEVSKSLYIFYWVSWLGEQKIIIKSMHHIDRSAKFLI